MKSYPITDFSPGEITREDPNEVNYFESTADFLRTCEKIGKLWPDAIQEHYKSWCKNGRDTWFGNKNYSEALDFLHQGDKSGAKKIAEAVKEAEGSLARKKLTWTPAVVGIIPSVPRYLAGIPSAMQKPLKTETRRKPLAIICQLNGGSNRAQRVIMQRAGRICALANALSQNHNVSIYGYANFDKYPVMIKAATPIDYSEIAALFAPSTLRQLVYLFALLRRKSGEVTLDPNASTLPFDRLKKETMRKPQNFSDDFLTIHYRELLSDDNLKEKIKEIIG